MVQGRPDALLGFSGDQVIAFFEPLGIFSQSNVAAAQKLAAMAAQLTAPTGAHN